MLINVEHPSPERNGPYVAFAPCRGMRVPTVADFCRVDVPERGFVKRECRSATLCNISTSQKLPKSQIIVKRCETIQKG